MPDRRHRLPRLAIVAASCVVCAGAVAAPSLAAGAGTMLVSKSSAERHGNGDSMRPSISADGRYVAFASSASDLVAHDTNGTSDVFIRDRQAGATRRVSVSSSEAEGNGSSVVPAISADGRYVAFVSDADNLVGGDTNGSRDIFLRDQQTGVTRRISVSSAGLEGNRSSAMPSISADGRYVAFASDADDLVAGDSNGQRDVFVRDRQADTTTLVSISTAGLQGNSYSESPAISADGHVIAFASGASDLVAGDTNKSSDVFLRNVRAGTTERISISSRDLQGAHSDGAFSPSISADGRYVAFGSGANDLIANDTNGDHDVFVRDRLQGITRRVSVSSAERQGDGRSFSPSMSADGSEIVFVSEARDLIANDTNRVRDIFVRDLQASTTKRVSVGAAGRQGDRGSYLPAVSADGRYVAFTSFAADLVAGDANGAQDIFLRGPLP